MFKDSSTQDSSINIQEYALSVTGVIRKCVDDVVPTITVQTYPNQKPCMNGDICSMLRARTAAFNVGRMNLDDSVVRNVYKASRYELRKSIRDAKRQYRLNTDSTRDACGKDYRLSRTTKANPVLWCPPKPPSRNELNTFYARFEADNTEPSWKTVSSPDYQVLSLSEADVRENSQKGEYSSPNRRPRCHPWPRPVCADQLTGVFSDIFNLSQAEIPTCFKVNTIPEPKKR